MILYRILLLNITTLATLSFVISGSRDEYGTAIGFPYAAIVNLTYYDPLSGEMKNEEEEGLGQYAADSRMDYEWGWVVHIRSSDGTHYGCSAPVNAPPSDERWIALIQRGLCRFHQKIENVAINMNASAVVVYNNEYSPLLSMKHKVDDVVSVFIRKESGDKIAALVDNGTRVLMHIARSDSQMSAYNGFGNGNRSSVLFVSVSFIILMIISLTWLVFYYVQRVRYAHGKDRLDKRLINSAKKAVNKMDQRTLARGDKETASEFELCAICVESYKALEVIRILPCRHIFHKSCVDPWLIERRTCPICKLDILRSNEPNIIGNRDLTTTTNLDASALLLEPEINDADTRAENQCLMPSRLSLDLDRELLLGPSVMVSCGNDDPTLLSPSGDSNDIFKSRYSLVNKETAQVIVEPTPACSDTRYNKDDDDINNGDENYNDVNDGNCNIKLS